MRRKGIGQQKADYMLAFEQGVIKQAPHCAGRIDWDTAQHYFYSGKPLAQAVASYIELKGVKS